MMTAETATYSLSHIRYLEAESIHVMREVVAEFERPVLLYSIGKDSSCLLRLAQKAFHPGKIPFPLMHVDTGYKFTEMYEFRDRCVQEVGADLLVWRNEPAIAAGANPFDLGTQNCCGFLKTGGSSDRPPSPSLRCRHRRRAARRGEIAREGALLLLP